MKGKDKCEFLKGIRKNIAEANGIPYEPRECTYEGDCTGTCPFCEKEAEELLAELKKKEAEGAEIKTDLFSIEAMEEEIRHLPSFPRGLNTLLEDDVALRMEESQRREYLIRLKEEERNRQLPLPGELESYYDKNVIKRRKEYELLRQKLDKNGTTGEVEKIEDKKQNVIKI